VPVSAAASAAKSASAVASPAAGASPQRGPFEQQEQQQEQQEQQQDEEQQQQQQQQPGDSEPGSASASKQLDRNASLGSNGSGAGLSPRADTEDEEGGGSPAVGGDVDVDTLLAAAAAQVAAWLHGRPDGRCQWSALPRAPAAPSRSAHLGTGAACALLTETPSAAAPAPSQRCAPSRRQSRAAPPGQARAPPVPPRPPPLPQVGLKDLKDKPKRSSALGRLLGKQRRPDSLLAPDAAQPCSPTAPASAAAAEGKRRTSLLRSLQRKGSQAVAADEVRRLRHACMHALQWPGWACPLRPSQPARARLDTGIAVRRRLLLSGS
jgi:hypothetical protein